MNRLALDDVFHALADSTRRSIVQQLAGGETTVMVLASRFDISQPAVTKHLNVLERAGLITRRAEGRTRTCKLRPEALDASQKWIDEMRAYWNSHLDALESFISKQAAAHSAKEHSREHAKRSKR